MRRGDEKGKEMNGRKEKKKRERGIKALEDDKEESERERRGAEGGTNNGQESEKGRKEKGIELRG